MAKDEIDKQFLLWPQCFQLYLTINLSFMEIFEVFATMFSKESLAISPFATMFSTGFKNDTFCQEVLCRLLLLFVHRKGLN